MDTLELAPVEVAAEAGETERRDGVFRRLIGNRKGLFGLAVLVLLVVVAALASVIAPYDPN